MVAMTDKHTPEPWTASERGWEILSPAAPRNRICDLRAANSDEEREANARLIAAAPTMHSELQIINDLAHRAANGSLKQPGKAERIGDLKAMLRRIAEIAASAAAKGNA